MRITGFIFMPAEYYSHPNGETDLLLSTLNLNFSKVSKFLKVSEDLLSSFS